MSGQRDLFARLEGGADHVSGQTPAEPPKAAAAKAAPARSRGVSCCGSGLYGRAYRGAGGAGASAAPSWHVYRRHGREGPAPSVRRGDRQLHGRGRRRSRHLDRGAVRQGRLAFGGRQRARRPDRPPSQVQEQIRPRSDHDHAAFRRKVRQQGLQHVRRPARGGRLGGERAFRAAGGRGGSRPAAVPADLRPRRSRRPACRTSARS